MSLKTRLAIRVVVMVPILGGLMFAPAGSFRFWQGWVFLAIFFLFSAIFIGYFYQHDRKLLERRLQNKEPRQQQKQFKMFWLPLWVCTLVLPGFDYRFGWSANLGGVPVGLSAVGQVLLCIGWLAVFHVMRFNTFASTIVQVEAGQKVITDGPYRLVRHPMYSAFMLQILSTPFALGSYWALMTALPLIPVLVFRLRDEERVLRQELQGYAEYCKHTRYRLIPSVF